MNGEGSGLRVRFPPDARRGDAPAPSCRLSCAACGWTPGSLATDPYPFRCPNAGRDDGDHVIRRWLELSPDSGYAAHASWRGSNPDPSSPFVRYRRFFHSWHVALANGLSDADYVTIIDEIDTAVARVAGRGFLTTAFAPCRTLGTTLGFSDAGAVWVKDETGNVSGSHKARHLMGVAIYLAVIDAIAGRTSQGAVRTSHSPRTLAVASCGNAALAAAVVARAIEWPLAVFVPDHASPAVIARLQELGASVTCCSRSSGSGDPSYLAFQQAIARGAVPFSCQGNENGLAIEGACTLAYEMAEQASSPGVRKSRSPEVRGPDGPEGDTIPIGRVFIQVGGGALASACIQGFQDIGYQVPRVHAVQTRGGYPLKRAYDALVDHIFACLATQSDTTFGPFATDDDRARYLASHASPALLNEAFAYARMHRSSFMRPWEVEPRSITGGILDDETYDWAVIVEAMIRTAGFPVVVDENVLEEANALARRATGINVDHTGSAGLAGLLALTQSVSRPSPDERVAVLFTGIRRED